MRPEEHGLVPNVLVFAALVLSATIGLFASWQGLGFW